MNKMKKYTVIIAVFVFLSVAGFFLLARVGSLFVREIATPVVFDGEALYEDTGRVGSKASYFSLADLSGRAVSLADFSGTPLLIVFWTTWNGASVDQLRILDEYPAQNGEALFKIISVNSQEDAGAVENFIRRGGYGVPVLLDETGAVGEQYRVGTLPLLYFLDADGIVRDIVFGVMSGNMIAEKFEIMIR